MSTNSGLADYLVVLAGSAEDKKGAKSADASSRSTAADLPRGARAA
ncbi:hypothetical protein V7968_28810 [Nocardia vulneris]